MNGKLPLVKMHDFQQKKDRLLSILRSYGFNQEQIEDFFISYHMASGNYMAGEGMFEAFCEKYRNSLIRKGAIQDEK